MAAHTCKISSIPRALVHTLDTVNLVLAFCYAFNYCPVIVSAFGYNNYSVLC